MAKRHRKNNLPRKSKLKGKLARLEKRREAFVPHSPHGHIRHMPGSMKK